MKSVQKSIVTKVCLGVSISLLVSDLCNGAGSAVDHSENKRIFNSETSFPGTFLGKAIRLENIAPAEQKAYYAGHRSDGKQARFSRLACPLPVLSGAGTSGGPQPENKSSLAIFGLAAGCDVPAHNSERLAVLYGGQHNQYRFSHGNCAQCSRNLGFVRNPIRPLHP